MEVQILVATVAKWGNSLAVRIFEVILPSELKVRGVILVDQIKCLDWKARTVQFVEVAPKSLIIEVQAKIEPLLL
jgi:mRNA interferase MazF